MITQTLTCTLNGTHDCTQVQMRQDDTGRKLAVNIIHNSEPFDLTGLTPEFEAKKTDGTGAKRKDGVTKSGNTVLVEIRQNELAVPGLVDCAIMLYNSAGKFIGTTTWQIKVWPATVNREGIKSSDDYEDMDKAAREAEAARDAAKEHAKDAAKSAGEAKDSAGNAANSAADAKYYKDTMRPEFDVQPARVGVKYPDEPVYTYTDDLTGPKGDKGETATIAVGKVVTAEPGTGAAVVNVGNENDAIFNFSLPKGDKGDKGDRGESGLTFSIDGQFTLYINESGHLMVVYPDGSMPPPLSINNNGELIYTFT